MKFLLFFALAIPLITLKAQNEKPSAKSVKFIKHELATPNVSKSRFHLYLLVGQSNMAGRGVVEPIDTIPNKRVYTLNRNNEWELAKDPIHFDKAAAGVGMGRSFGAEMAKEDTSVIIGLIPCAQGGSSIDSWIPGGYHDQTKSYPYDYSIERLHTAMKFGEVKGILWHQGESDANAQKCVYYEEKLINLIARFRKEIGNDSIPFVAGELADYIVSRNGKNLPAITINKTIRKLGKKVEFYASVSPKGFAHIGDNTHFDAPSQREFGKRYAKAMKKIQKKRK